MFPIGTGKVMLPLILNFDLAPGRSHRLGSRAVALRLAIRSIPSLTSMAAVTRIMVHSPGDGESKIEVKEYLETRGGVKESVC